MTIKLKPCPFCGGAGAFREYLMSSCFGTTRMKVECMACQVVTPGGIGSRDNFECPSERALAEKRAAERWNTRHE